jgi:hypothetical protein
MDGALEIVGCTVHMEQSKIDGCMEGWMERSKPTHDTDGALKIECCPDRALEIDG